MAGSEKHKTIADCKAAIRHNERKPYDHNHSNEKIDNERTKNNIILHKSDLEKRLSEVRIFNRGDVVHCFEWLITLPKEVEISSQKSCTDESIVFFQESLEFMKNRYGEKNIISAVIHNDETTPHLHLLITPVIPDKKNGGEKLCCKNVLNRKELITFHPDLSKHLKEVMGYDVGVLNGATDNGNKTVQRLKAETLQAENEKLQAENKALAEKTQQEIKALKEQTEKLEKNNTEIEQKISDFTPKNKIFGKESQAEVIVRNANQIKADAGQTAKQIISSANFSAKELTDETNNKIQKANNEMKNTKEILKEKEQALKQREQALEQREQAVEYKEQSIDKDVKQRVAESVTKQLEQSQELASYMQVSEQYKQNLNYLRKDDYYGNQIDVAECDKTL